MTTTPPIHPHTMGDTWHPDERAAIISYGDERAKEAREALIRVAQPAPAQGAGEVVAVAREALEFFAYHPEMGVEFFKTQRDAVTCTDSNLGYEREGAIDSGEWDDSAAESTCWGVVVQRAKAVQYGVSDEGVAHFDYVLSDTHQRQRRDVLLTAAKEAREALAHVVGLHRLTHEAETLKRLDEAIAAHQRGQS